MKVDLFSIISIILATGTLITSICAIIVQNKYKKLKNDIKKHFEDFYFIEDKIYDVVIIGPRYSGKTSLLGLWFSPWFDISKTKPSNDMVTININGPDIKKYNKFDSTFGLERTYREKLVLRVHAYTGEEAQREEAFKGLPNLNNPVLILFLYIDANNTGLINDNKNNTYYSKKFMLSIKDKYFKYINKVFVIINKIDLLPKHLNQNSKEVLKLVRINNSDAIERIESLFSPVEYRLISCETNENITKLLGDLVSSEVKEIIDLKNNLNG